MFAFVMEYMFISARTVPFSSQNTCLPIPVFDIGMAVHCCRYCWYIKAV